MDRYATGLFGERQAKEYLENKGYRILALNVNYPNVGELDIVAKDGQTLVFVEVRTRADNAFGHPLETLTKAKIRNIVKASRRFLTENKILAQNYRYDAVGIIGGSIEHVIDAFYAKW